MVLTPRAEALVSPLHTLLMDAERLLGGGPTFDPATTARRFVIAAADFLATLLMPALLDAAAREAPGTSLEIVPSSRRGNAWLLETGDVDLALGAIVDEAPGIRRMDLLTEGFACAARKGRMPCSRLRNMFSIMTMASSTTNPTEIASAISDRLSIE